MVRKERDELLTLVEAADVAGCSPSTLRREIRLGFLDAEKKGKTWLTTQSKVDKWKELGRYKPHMIRR